MAKKEFNNRELTIQTIQEKFNLTPFEYNGCTCVEIDGVKYEVKVHKMPYKDKCLIVNYTDLVEKTNLGLLFINPLTDFQDVCYIVKDRTNLHKTINAHLSRLTKGDWIWMSKPDENKLYKENNNFIGVTMRVDNLLNEGLCEELKVK